MKESRKHRAILLNEMSDHKTALIPTARNNVLYQLHMCNTWTTMKGRPTGHRVHV